MVNASNLVITDITLSPSGDGVQFNLHVIDGQQEDFVLVLTDLLAALNVRN